MKTICLVIFTSVQTTVTFCFAAGPSGLQDRAYDFARLGPQASSDPTPQRQEEASSRYGTADQSFRLEAPPLVLGQCFWFRPDADSAALELRPIWSGAAEGSVSGGQFCLPFLGGVTLFVGKHKDSIVSAEQSLVWKGKNMLNVFCLINAKKNPENLSVV